MYVRIRLTNLPTFYRIPRDMFKKTRLLISYWLEDAPRATRSESSQRSRCRPISRKTRREKNDVLGLFFSNFLLTHFFLPKIRPSYSLRLWLVNIVSVYLKLYQSFLAVELSIIDVISRINCCASLNYRRKTGYLARCSAAIR